MRPLAYLLTLLCALASRSKSDTVVVDKRAADASTKEKQSQSQNLDDHLPHLRRVSRLGSAQAAHTQLPSQCVVGLLAASPPHISARGEHQVVCDSVSNGGFGLGLKGFAVGLVHALFGEHLDRLAAASDDSGDGGDQTEREQVVARAGKVGARWQSIGESIWEVATKAVQDVEAVTEREEGEGEVDGCGVDWFPV